MEALEASQQWVKDNGGYMHPSVSLQRDSSHGVHFHTDATSTPGTSVLHVPTHSSLSNLNAQVDETFPVFKSHTDSFTVEAMSFFYLCAQWLTRETSFWKPYLDASPRPEDGMGTPFWFDEEDLMWLEGTDLGPSFVARRDIWRGYWRDGIEVMKEAGMDTEGYTWDLFKWAATIFTSRSFNSTTIRPSSSKYWAAYKHTPSGLQTVLLDLSHHPASYSTFAVSHPLFDAGNHSPFAKVDWTIDPGRFSSITQDSIADGGQVFNNYGPKGNEELLMGYGFCVSGNPNDGVHLALRAPPGPSSEMSRESHRGYFRADGSWNSEAATFRILRSHVLDATGDGEAGNKIWQSIPAPSAESFYYIIRSERGSEVEPPEDPEQHLYAGEGRKYLPRIAFYIVMSIVPKLQKLVAAAAELPSEPQNQMQANAKIYRDGQYETLVALQEGMSGFLKSSRVGDGVEMEEDRVEGKAGGIWTLEEAMDSWGEERPDDCSVFSAGIKAAYGTRKLKKFRGTEQEEVIWVSFINFSASGSFPDGESMVAKWRARLEDEYGAPQSGERGGEGEPDPDAAEYSDAVETAAAASPGSLWSNGAWDSDFVLDWGVRILKSQGTMMDVGEGEEDDVRYVMYSHTGRSE